MQRWSVTKNAQTAQELSCSPFFGPAVFELSTHIVFQASTNFNAAYFNSSDGPNLTFFPPWRLLAAVFAGLGADHIVVEESPHVINYPVVAGGSTKKGHENHLRNHQEHVLIVHRVSPDGRPFTCNKRVVPRDVFGIGAGRIPQAKQMMEVEALPNGAPNGGPRCCFPVRTLQFLIGR